MNLSGWDFLWLPNEASAVWPSTPEPGNGIWLNNKEFTRANLTVTVDVKIPNRVRAVWTSPPTSPASPLLLWQGRQTENAVTPGAQLNQALQRKLFTVVQRGQSRIPDEKPHRALLSTDTTCGLESTTGQSQKDFRGKPQHACPDVCYARKGDCAQHSSLDLCPAAGSETTPNGLLENLCRGRMNQLELCSFS